MDRTSILCLYEYVYLNMFLSLQTHIKQSQHLFGNNSFNQRLRSHRKLENLLGQGEFGHQSKNPVRLDNIKRR